MLMRDFFVTMVVIVRVLTVNMEMRMCMRVLMDVGDISVSVLMGVGMLVFMGVLQFDGVLNHETSADDHDDQRNIELNGRSFP